MAKNDNLQKIKYASIGAAVEAKKAFDATKKTVEGVFKKLVSEGKASQKDVDVVKKNIRQKLEATEKYVNSKIKDGMKASFKKMGVPSKEYVQELEQRIADLEKKMK